MEYMKNRLGRIESPPDDRDFLSENFVRIGRETSAVADPISLANEAISELKQTTVSYPKWASTKYSDVTQTHWWKALNALSQIVGPAPTPTPSQNVVWVNNIATLDQGDYGTCVGHGAAQWGNTEPVVDNYTEKDARALYYEATILDGSPDNPDAPGGGQQGATVRSGMKALYNRRRNSAYARATTLTGIKDWLHNKGPIVIGSNWYDDMFDPDKNGYVVPTGPLAGGHCFLLAGDLVDEGAFWLQNSWGTSWGPLAGYFKMKYDDFQDLLDAGGEAWVSLELSLS